MSRRKNDYTVENKIQDIREDLQRLTSNYKSSDIKEQSPLEKYLEVKYPDPAFKISEITESPFIGTKESQDIKKESQLKSSYSVDDLKDFEGQPSISPKFSQNPKSKPYVSDYVAFGHNSKEPARHAEIIDPTISTAYREKTDFTMARRNDQGARYEITEKDASLRKTQGSRHSEQKYTEPINNLRASARGLEDKANDLENAKIALQEENTQLHQKLMNLEKDINYIESKSLSMRDEIKSLRSNNADLESQILNLKKEKVEYLRQIDELKRIENQKNSEIETAAMQKREFEERIQELKQLLHDSSMTKYKAFDFDEKENINSLHLKDEISELKNENNKLKNALKRKPSCDEIRKATKKIEQLENAIEDIRGQKRRRSESAKRTRERSPKLPPIRPRSASRERNRPRSASRERKHENSPIRHLTSATCAKIVRELMHEFSVESASLLIPSAKLALRDLKSQSHQRKLVERLRSLIIDCSPPGAFDKNPSLKRIWKWIRRLTEEYLQLKKESNQNATEKEVLIRLKKALSVENTEEIPRSLTKLLAENENLLLILNKVKAAFRLNTRVTLQELEKEIDRRL
ncbi:unnamed protein product [Blepharisma stoltei]|uniref:Uncharacterized protein n=1 Tax=Blepharisma stoltei TaxID=1481888 RepID=A0AAU9K5U5_9CILI|nr:unnamed protein product [Blepharisma stoltei]